MYSEEYDNDQEINTNGNFITNFYYNNKILIWIFIGVIVFILLMSILTKGGSNTEVDIKYDVKIYPEESVEISIGNSTKLIAQVTNKSDPEIVWTSSDEKIAKVDNGTVTGVNYGQATITATYDKYYATKVVTVADGNPNLALTDVEFKDGSLLMPPHSNYNISLSLTPSNGHVTSKQFTSSNDQVVTVDNTGHVESIGEGEATINLNVNDGTFKKSLKVYVNKDYTSSEIVVTPESIKIDGELRKMKVGISEKLNYTVFPENVDKTKLVWISSDPSVVTVDESGIIRALKEGNAVITIKSVTGISDSIDVEVETDIIEVSDINVSLNELYLSAEQSQVITPVVIPENASNKVLSYSALDASIISVSSNDTGTQATITGLRAGNTTLIIKANNNIEKRLNVTVSGNNSGGSSGGSSSGGSSSTSQGFTISSSDAEGKGYINTTYERTKPANNGAKAPVTITLNITDSSISKLRVMECTYPAGVSCNPSNASSNVHVINGSGSFTMTTAGEYVLRIGKYDSNNQLKGSFVDKYIWIKTGSSSSSSNTSTELGFTAKTSSYKDLSTSEYDATLNNQTAPTAVTIRITSSNVKSLSACWAYAKECSGASKTITSGSIQTEKLTSKGIYIVVIKVIYKDGTTKNYKRYIYITGSGTGDNPTGEQSKATPTITLDKTSLSLTSNTGTVKFNEKVDVLGTITNMIADTSCVKFDQSGYSNVPIKLINQYYGIVLKGQGKNCSTTVTITFVPNDTSKYKAVTKTLNVSISGSTVSKWTCRKTGTVSSSCGYTKYNTNALLESAVNSNTTITGNVTYGCVKTTCLTGIGTCYAVHTCTR